MNVSRQSTAEAFGMIHGGIIAGKSTLTDSLVAAAGIIAMENVSASSLIPLTIASRVASSLQATKLQSHLQKNSS